MKRLLLSCLLSLSLCSWAQTYTNPIVTPVAADPSIIRAPDGTFYLYATQDDWADGDGNHYLPIFRSDDLVEWAYVADAFTGPPEWKTGGGFVWAPDVSFLDGTYNLYYAASLWGDPNPCIGRATAPSPEGPWTDLGRPVFCSQEVGVENSIDPFVWEEDGAHTLIWGSFHGIYAVALSADGTQAQGEKVELAAGPFEGAYVYRHDENYYLFLSSGSCCDGADSTYHVVVGRSPNLTGPYLDKVGRNLRLGGETNVLVGNGTFVGPGHVSAIRDDAGVDWLLYHAIPLSAPRLANGVNHRPALLDKLDWVDGWPVVNGGEGPSFEPRPAPSIAP